VRSQEIARRYAAALYQVSVEDGAVQKIDDELASLAAGTSDGAEVRRFLAHPLISREKKSVFLEKAFPETTNRMRNFLELLVHNRRESYLDLIYEEFVSIRTADEGMIQVTLRTAQALSDEDRGRVRARLESALSRPVRLAERIDADMLGGVRIEAAGHVLDGTIRARLSDLRRQLEK
jgi:F-type H+-transporting ATPase subunit delta